MSLIELDERGRMTLPKAIRKSMDIGNKVLLINAGDHLKIIPLPSDPLKILHGALNMKKSFRELRRQAEKTIENWEGSRSREIDAPDR